MVAGKVFLPESKGKERGAREERFDVSRSKPRVFTRRVLGRREGGVLGCIQASNNIRISKAEHRRRGRKPTRIWMRMAQFSAAVALTSETWRALSANLFRLCLSSRTSSQVPSWKRGENYCQTLLQRLQDIIRVWCEFTRASFAKRSRGKKIATINFAMFKFKINVGQLSIFPFPFPNPRELSPIIYRLSNDDSNHGIKIHRKTPLSLP